MWSETIGYREHRHPYLKRFFPAVAAAIPLTGKEDLLDLGCGTGEVALGLAPFVASLTGLDLERPMLEEARKRAKAAGREMRLVNARVEDAPEDLGQFHLITMGRVHWFMHSPASLDRLERWLMPGGHILICMPVPNPEGAAWHRHYDRLRNGWAKGGLQELMKLRIDEFFQGTDFVEVNALAVRGKRPIDLDSLIKRALGTPSTTPAILGADTHRMIAELRAGMAPYFANGPIMEKHTTLGILYRRRRDSRPATAAG